MRVIIKIGVIFSLIASMFSCKFDDEVVSRTNIFVTPSEGFEVSDFRFFFESQDFTMDSMRFSATFNEEASWRITITTDGPVGERPERIITGTSTELDLNEVFWDGSSDNVFFFNVGDNLVITPETIDGRPLSNPITNETIQGTKDFEGILVLDFEVENSKAILGPEVVNPFFDPGERIIQCVSCGLDLGIDTLPSTPAPQGNRYLYLKGQDILGGDGGAFFVGGANNSPFLFGVESDLDNTFLNFIANSNGNRTTTLTPRVIGIGGDEFGFAIDVTWEGWRQVSIRLSDMVQLETGALGTGFIVPEQIKQLSFTLSSTGVAGNPVEILIDNVVITEGGPFRQSN